MGFRFSLLFSHTPRDGKLSHNKFDLVKFCSNSPQSTNKNPRARKKVNEIRNKSRKEQKSSKASRRFPALFNDPTRSHGRASTGPLPTSVCGLLFVWLADQWAVPASGCCIHRASTLNPLISHAVVLYPHPPSLCVKRGRCLISAQPAACVPRVCCLAPLVGDLQRRKIYTAFVYVQNIL